MITYSTVILVGPEKVEYDVDMSYTSEDPAMVTFDFTPCEGEQTVSWIFGRDLLKKCTDGEDSGDGDIKFYPEEESIFAVLTSPEGTAVAEFERCELEEFVEMVYEEVPEGEDSYTIPDEIPAEWLV